MSGRSGRQVFPRRDADGHVISLAEWVAAAMLGTLTGWVILAAIDGLLALLGLGAIGRVSGWIAIVPALLFFVDDFRAWRGTAVRIAVAFVAAVLGLVAGLAAAGAASVFAPLISGGVGAGVFALCYSVVWFVGIRWLTGHRGEKEPKR